MIIKKATIELDGKYSCVIKNDYGKVEDECIVDVNCKSVEGKQEKRFLLLILIFIGQPKIVKSLKETEINEGDTLTLEVEIYAKPEPKIVW